MTKSQTEEGHARVSGSKQDRNGLLIGHERPDDPTRGHQAHEPGHHHGTVDNVGLALLLNFSFAVLEITGGIWIGSMAIVADAIHDFGDSVSLAMAWFLERYANRARDQKFNFGYRRFSLLSAVISGLVITAGSAVIIYESFSRLNSPEPPQSLPMIGLACLGLAINSFAAWRLSRGETQNEKVLAWHLFEDVLGWAAVLAGAIVIHFTKITWLDPALAIGLAIFVSLNVFRHLKNTLYLFLQGRPQNFREEKFRAEVLAVNGVEHIDHLAVWSLDGETSVLSARLHLHAVRDPMEIERVKNAVRKIARRHKAMATLETCMAEQAPHPEESESSS